MEDTLQSLYLQQSQAQACGLKATFMNIYMMTRCQGERCWQIMVCLSCTQALFGNLTLDVIVLTMLYSTAGLGIAIVNDFKSIEGDRSALCPSLTHLTTNLATALSHLQHHHCRYQSTMIRELAIHVFLPSERWPRHAECLALRLGLCGSSMHRLEACNDWALYWRRNVKVLHYEA